MRTAALACAAAAALFLCPVSSAEEDLIGKACSAHGDMDSLLAAKTLSATGCLKNLAGGFEKFEFTLKVRFPEHLVQSFKGVDGTFGSFGFVLKGAEAWKKSNESSRKMWPDEADEMKQNLFDVALLARVRKGEVKSSPLDDKTVEPDAFECAGLKLDMPDGREVSLWFDKSTWLLYRMDETSRDRDGSVSKAWTVFEDYEDFCGVKWAATRSVYLNMLIPGTSNEKFQLVQKTQYESVETGVELADSDFTPPQDEFFLHSPPSGGQTSVDFFLGQFKGRRQPDRAAWACVGLSKFPAEGVAAAKNLLASADKDIKFFGALALLRAGQASDLPEEFDASKTRAKVAAELKIPEKAGKIQVTLVGSGGVKVAMGGKTAYLNAFYQPGLFNTQFPALDPKTVGQAGLLLFTHARRDAFDPWTAAEVAARTNSTVVGPPSVVALLKKLGVRENLLVQVEPGEEKPVKVEAGGFTVHAFAVPHAGEHTKGGAPEHVAFAVENGDLKVVHFGDADATKNMDETLSKGADVLFLPHWMLSVRNHSFLNSSAPRFIVPLRSLDAPGSYSSLLKLRERFARVVPMLPGHQVDF